MKMHPSAADRLLDERGQRAASPAAPQPMASDQPGESRSQAASGSTLLAAVTRTTSASPTEQLWSMQAAISTIMLEASQPPAPPPAPSTYQWMAQIGLEASAAAAAMRALS